MVGDRVAVGRATMRRPVGATLGLSGDAMLTGCCGVGVFVISIWGEAVCGIDVSVGTGVSIQETNPERVCKEIVVLVNQSEKAMAQMAIINAGMMGEVPRDTALTGGRSNVFHCCAGPRSGMGVNPEACMTVTGT